MLSNTQLTSVLLEDTLYPFYSFEYYDLNNPANCLTLDLLIVHHDDNH